MIRRRSFWCWLSRSLMTPEGERVGHPQPLRSEIQRIQSHTPRNGREALRRRPPSTRDSPWLATVGSIGANRENPGRFFYENLMMGAQMMEQARLPGVQKFVAGGRCARTRSSRRFRSGKMTCGTEEKINWFPRCWERW